MTRLTLLLVSLRASFRLTARGGFLLPPLQFAFFCPFRWRFVGLFGVPAFQERIADLHRETLGKTMAASSAKSGPAASRGGALTNMRVLLLAAYLRAMLSAGLAVAAAGCDAGALECQVLVVI